MSSTTSRVTVLDAHGVTEAQQQAIESLYRGVCGEFHLLDEAVTPDWRDIPAAPGSPPGPDAVKPHFAEFHEQYHDMKIVLHEILGVEGRVAVRGEIRGKLVGEWLGVQGRGEECSIPIHEIHHFEGDRIKVSWHMEDWISFVRQLGASTLTLA